MRIQLAEYKRCCHVNRNCLPFPFYVGSMFHMRRFQLIRQCVSTLTVISPTMGSWCYQTTGASDFLSFSSTAPLSPSLSCPQILLLISIHDYTTSNYFHALFGYFSHLRYPPHSFIPYSVQLNTPLIHLNAFISATYCDFFTAHVGAYIRLCPGSRSIIHILYYHYIIIWQSLLPIAHSDFLTRHSIVRLPCFSIRCRTANIASAIPLPGIKPNCASLCLLSIILSQIFKVYQSYPSAIHTILDVSLLCINLYNQTISPLC